MPAPTRTDPGLSRREEMAVSSDAMSSAPWAAAGLTGAVVTAGDLGLHLIGGSIFSLHALSGSLSLGLVAFLVVAAAGAALSKRSGRTARWVRNNPWRFAVLPGVACAAIVFVLSVVLGGGVFGGIFSALWHGAATYGLTGLAGSIGSTRNRRD
ncbi:MAG TPA: hypothetical protein VHY58_17470 [Streptosporangiaceae bacterium]|jgi:hypothetical protein|nr:hypothetical protein [Streptosporangiaceae bacterium]